MLEHRRRLGLTQSSLASSSGISPQMVAAIESAGANPSVGVVMSVLDQLGLDLELIVRERAVVLTATPRRQDAGHSMCSGHVQRRISALPGWELRREVRIDSGRYHGWIDLLAFHAESGTLVIIEIKTRFDDLGALERTLDWYVREAAGAARRFGWHTRRIVPWVLALATDEVETSMRTDRTVIDAAFPGRAGAMDELLADPGALVSTPERSASSLAAPVAMPPSIALIDPRSRRRTWLIRSRLDGRRSPAPYRDYADFMRASATGRR